MASRAVGTASSCGLIVAGRQGYDILDCRVGRRSAGALLFALEGGAPAVAIDVHLEDGGAVDEAIDGGEGHGGVWEALAPFAERLVGGDQGGAALVAAADQLEENGGLGLLRGDVGQVVEDQEVEAVEPGDGRFEGQLATGEL